MEGIFLTVYCKIGNDTFFSFSIFRKFFTLIKYANTGFQNYLTRIGRET